MAVAKANGGKSKIAAKRLDLLVVGASASGSSAAFAAARSGLTVAVYAEDDRLAGIAATPLQNDAVEAAREWPFGEAGHLLRQLSNNPDPEAWRVGYRMFPIRFEPGHRLAQLSRLPDGAYRAVFNDAQQRPLAVEATQVLLTELPIDRAAAGSDLQTAGVALDPHFFAPRPELPICVVGGGNLVLPLLVQLAERYPQQIIVYCETGEQLAAIPVGLRGHFADLCLVSRRLRIHIQAAVAGLLQGRNGTVLGIRLAEATEDGLTYTRYLEFPPSQCLVLMDPDFPGELLAELDGVCERRGARRLPVVDLGYRALPGLYLTGALLAPRHLRREAGSALREVVAKTHLGEAVVEGMMVAHQVIQSAAGTLLAVNPPKSKSPETAVSSPFDAAILGALARQNPETSGRKVRISLTDASTPSAPAISPERPRLMPDSLRLEKRLRLARPESAKSALISSPAPMPVPERTPAAPGTGVLVRLHADSGEDPAFPLQIPVTNLDRLCRALFPEREAAERVRASVLYREDGFCLRDEGCATGIFYALDPHLPRRVDKGDLLRLGGQFLVCDRDQAGLYLRHYDQLGSEGACFRIGVEPLVLGRTDFRGKAGEDGNLARRHLACWLEGEELRVRDLGSAHGSYLRLIREFPMRHGDVFLIGGQRLRFQDLGQPVVAEKRQPQVGTDQGEARLTIVGMGGPFTGPAGATVAEIAEAHGLPMDCDCRMGACGIDAVRIVSGSEHVDRHMDPLELDTLTRICQLKPGSCRLACKLRVYGSVRVRLLKGSA